MKTKTKCISEPPNLDDGTRILVARYPHIARIHRSKKRWNYDLEFPNLGPSPQLHREYIKLKQITWDQYIPRYLEEMQGQQHQSLIRDLHLRSKHSTITLLCYCKDTQKCHRYLLKELIDNWK